MYLITSSVGLSEHINEFTTFIFLLQSADLRTYSATQQNGDTDLSAAQSSPRLRAQEAENYTMYV